MPVEALLSRLLPEPFESCPRCHARPFESFLRGQVTRFSWFGMRRSIWAIICRDCKDIVGYEPIEPTSTPESGSGTGGGT